METIRELREMLQREKVSPVGWTRPWGYKTLQRGPSIYITRALLPTRIRANHITVIGILSGFVGAWMTLSPELGMKFWGLFFLYINTLLDRVDGEIARYRKEFSLKGIYLDEINHLVVPPLFFLALTFGLPPFTIFSDALIMAVGALGAIALVVIRVTNHLPQLIYMKKFLKYRELFALPSHESSETSRTEDNSFLKSISRAFHLSQELFLIILFFAVLLFVERFTRLDYAFHPFLSWGIAIETAALIVIAAENIIKGTRNIERVIARLEENASFILEKRVDERSDH